MISFAMLFYGFGLTISVLFIVCALGAPHFLQKVITPIFGVFEREEFKKFLRLGFIFLLVFGTYWALRGLKKSIFFKLDDASQIPYAKTLSIICLMLMIFLYNNLQNRYPRERIFYVLCVFFSGMILAFGIAFYYVQASPELIALRDGLPLVATHILGYVWYVFVESFGSLFLASFWAIATQITNPDSAKKGFSLVVAFGQIGGIVLPIILGVVSHELPRFHDMIPVLLCCVSTAALFFMMRWFLKVTPSYLLRNDFDATAKNVQDIEAHQRSGTFAGLSILRKSSYLWSILGVIGFFEIIGTIFDFRFDCAAQAALGKGAELTAYTLQYASFVNIVALILLLIGANKIMRYINVKTALSVVPLIFGGAIVSFFMFDSLSFLFWLMVCSKAINYAVAIPANKQLYIPISEKARFRAQAWVETLGSRGGKEMGSVLNMLFKPLALGFISLGIAAVWFFVALFLGKTYHKALEEKKLVC